MRWGDVSINKDADNVPYPVSLTHICRSAIRAATPQL